MPIYDYICHSCGLKEDVWAKMDEQSIPCSCGETAHRVLSATRGNCDLEPYFDDHLCKMGETGGTYVKSRQHRKEVMKTLGLVDKWSYC